MYRKYAIYYDQLYQTKNYEKETSFLDQILSENKIRTVLDVGCGTGTHLSTLEQFGYICEGIDFNIGMIEVAKMKLQGRVLQADMRNFNLNQQYDAIISMFAVFNHNLNLVDAQSTLLQLKKHLNQNGILILDLYNPQSSGEKVNSFEGITRVMTWQLNAETEMCESLVKFIDGNTICEEIFLLKIYSISLMKQLLTETGFKEVKFYDNYTFNEGTELSKNLIVAAK